MPRKSKAIIAVELLAAPQSAAANAPKAYLGIDIAAIEADADAELAAGDGVTGGADAGEADVTD